VAIIGLRGPLAGLVQVGLLLVFAAAVPAAAQQSIIVVGATIIDGSGRMFVHGENDKDVPIAEAEQFYIALKDVASRRSWSAMHARDTAFERRST
jgi:hypothetical protein